MDLKFGGLGSISERPFRIGADNNSRRNSESTTSLRSGNSSNNSEENSRSDAIDRAVNADPRLLTTESDSRVLTHLNSIADTAQELTETLSQLPYGKAADDIRAELTQLQNSYNAILEEVEEGSETSSVVTSTVTELSLPLEPEDDADDVEAALAVAVDQVKAGERLNEGEVFQIEQEQTAIITEQEVAEQMDKTSAAAPAIKPEEAEVLARKLEGQILSNPENARAAIGSLEPLLVKDLLAEEVIPAVTAREEKTSDASEA